MNLAIAAAAILALIFVYIALRWRKSRKVFKAMNLVAAAGVVAGLLTGVWLVGLASDWLPSHSPTGGGVSDGENGSRSDPSGTMRSTTPPDLNEQLGVFADTSSGITDVPCWGAAEDLVGLGPSTVHFKFTRSDCVPRLSNIRAFLINLPGADVTNSNVYGLVELDAHWTEGGASADPQPLKDTIQKHGNVFRIESPEFGAIHQGFITLVVKMPLGTPDRMYAVELGK